jgi:hypothetical protein
MGSRPPVHSIATPASGPSKISSACRTWAMRPPLRPTTDQDSVCSTRPWSRSIRLLMITGGALSLLTISDAFIYLALQRRLNPDPSCFRCSLS